MASYSVERSPITEEGYVPIRILTDRGDIDCRYYHSEGAKIAAIFVGGIGGDFDTPAKGLYPRLCKELMPEGISTLRVQFRHPTDLNESVFDVLNGLEFLQGDGVKAAGLAGHSFGGAVVIQAAVAFPAVRTVVALATQGYGADLVSDLRPDQSILLIHGTADGVLSFRCSEKVYEMAHEPKKLLLYKGAGHGLDEAAEEVYKVVHDWLLEKLKQT